MNYLAIFIGGGIGSLLRYLTSVAFRRIEVLQISSGTIVSNTVSSLLLGFFVAFFLSKNIDNSALKNFILIGVCGGFSTFSTFSLENYKFIENGQYHLLFFYITASVVLSILAIYLGFMSFNFIK